MCNNNNLVVSPAYLSRVVSICVPLQEMVRSDRHATLNEHSIDMHDSKRSCTSDQIANVDEIFSAVHRNSVFIRLQ